MWLNVNHLGVNKIVKTGETQRQRLNIARSTVGSHGKSSWKPENETISREIQFP